MGGHKTAVALFAGTVGVDKQDFIETLSKHRKDKFYPLNPISIQVTPNGVVDNSDVIKQGIALMRSRADEAIKNELSVENMELVKKEFNEVYEWLKTTRTYVTSGFDSIKSNYTANEKELKENIIGDIDKQILKMKEKTFQITEKNIKKHLEALIEEHKDLGIGLDIFFSFIADKRRNSGMLPSESTGKTGAGALRTINDEFEKIAKPIREAQELNKRKDLQSKIFEQSLDAIKVDSNFEAGIEALYQLNETVDVLFPDISDACKRSVKNKIEKAEANLRAKNALVERDKAEAELNALKSHDEPMMEQVNTLNFGITTDSVEVLNDKLSKLREIHPKLKDKDNQQKVVDIANTIKINIEKEDEVVEVKPKAEETVQNHKKQYGITDDAINDITFELQMMNVEATDVAEARGELMAKIAEMFKIEFIKEL